MARREWGRTCKNQKVSLCAKERIFGYKLDSFVGFIGDEQLHAQECYAVPLIYSSLAMLGQANLINHGCYISESLLYYKLLSGSNNI
jgi:hypothetical protein